MADPKPNFCVIYPVTSIGAPNEASIENVVVTTTTSYIESPVAQVTLKSFPLQYQDYILDPAWWEAVTDTLTWKLGLEGPQTGDYPVTQYATSIADAPEGPKSSPEASLPSSSSTISSVSSTSSSTDSPTTDSTTSPVAATSAFSNTTQPTHHGFNPAEATGIGIGCAAAGAIVAAIVICLFMRRKPSRSRSYGEKATMESPPSDVGSSIPEITGSTVPLTARNGDVSDLILPPPEANSALVQRFSSLNTFIKNHAASFFSGGPPNPAIRHGQIDDILGTHSPLNAKSLSKLLNGPKREQAVRFLIGWAILSNIEAHSSPDYTLLPQELVECLHSMRQNAAPDSTLLSKWRHLSGILLDPVYGSKVMAANDLRQSNIKKLKDALDETLAPLATPGRDLERRSNLEEIIKLAAQHGYVLLTQPTTWEFQWEDARAQAGRGFVVFPELVQVEDDQGRLLEKPHKCGTKQVA